MMIRLFFISAFICLGRTREYAPTHFSKLPILVSPFDATHFDTVAVLLQALLLVLLHSAQQSFGILLLLACLGRLALLVALLVLLLLTLLFLLLSLLVFFVLTLLLLVLALLLLVLFVLLVLLVLLILLLVLVLSLLVLVLLVLVLLVLLLVLVLVVLLVLLVLLALLQQSLCIRQVIAGVVVLGVQFQRLAVVVDGLLEVLSAVFTVGETRLEVAVATVVEYALPLCGVEVFALQCLSIVLGGLCVVLLAVEGVAQVVVTGPIGTVSI